MTRRDALLGFGGAALGAAAAAGTLSGGVVASNSSGVVASNRALPPSSPADVRGGSVQAAGLNQAGITRPETPQSHTLLHVYDIGGEGITWASAVGASIASLTTASPLSAELFPDGHGDLTLTVGVGARLSTEVAGLLDGGLPAFAQDGAIAETNRGGDVLISACATDPGILAAAIDAVAQALPAAVLRWSQRGHRSPGEGTVVRNPLGFYDGVIVPRGEAEQAENVWITEGTFAGGTVCVIRRLRLKVAEFAALSLKDQEATIGRRKADGAPLSGGVLADQAGLRAKSPEGDYLVPARSHIRAAHPSFTGSKLMFRRGYGFDNGVVDGIQDSGLLFVCFQDTQRTFVATQQRLDETDDLMTFATPTATASFVILPGGHLFA